MSPDGGYDATSDVPAQVFDPVRLEAVRGTGLLGSATQESWDGLTVFAARLLRAPMAFMTLVDDMRSFWLSSVGVEVGGPEPRQYKVEESVCQYVIADRAPLVVNDATQHARTRNNALVNLLGVRAWAGYPVLNANGQTLGAFCVMDVVPRVWSSDDIELLGVLAQAASDQLSLLTAVASERAAREDATALRDSERRAEARLQRLAFVALELVGAETIEDLTEIVVNKGLPVLGADGGAVVVRAADEDVVRLAVSDRLGEEVQITYGVLPVDDPLPAAYVARTGERLLFPTRASGLAFTPEMGPLYEATKRNAWAFTPLKIGHRLLGALAVSWVDERRFTDDELTVIEAFGAQCAQALDRIRIEGAQYASALKIQRLAEALQRSLLTQPPTPPELDIAFRYLPAVMEAQIGGDWYDAFDNASGATVISVGDVAGHDGNAAAAMAQLRNLLRGLAVDSDDSPAMLLSRLDRAIARLDLDTLATALIARIDAGPADRSRGVRRVRWSSAGHLPPLLRLPDGTVRILSDNSDLLLGLDPHTDRVERVNDLPDGSALVLYTDGLVERRGQGLDAGLGRLAESLAAVGHAGAEEVCDKLLKAMLPHAPEDDVALLVLKPRARTW
ncbi:MAG: putative sensor protein [Frankiales bacterium]|nr:putative sensor protein [Frankiales bacterium]